MFKRFFTRKQTSILSAAFVIASMVLASRMLGLIRNRMLTARFATEEIDLYFAALRIPNFLFEILVAGAITVAFIPVFTSYLSKRQRSEAFELASIILNIAVVTVGVFVIVMLFITPAVLKIIVPGFTNEQIVLTASYTRIVLLLQVVPLVIGNILTGILQSYKRFLIPAMAPVVYNLGSIFGILFLTPHIGLSGALYGIGIGAMLFMLIQLPLLRTVSYRHLPLFNLRHKGVRRVAKLMLPRTLVVGASQIDATIDFMLASLIGPGSITIFTFAQQLQFLPIGLFSLPIAQAALPTFSDYAAQENMKLFKKSLLASLHQVLFFIMPAATFLIVMKIPVVRLVYGAEQFDWPSTVLTGRTLMFFSFSLFAQGIVHLLSRAFFALHDSKTPVIIAICSIVLNSIVSLILVLGLDYPVWALALSTSVSVSIQAYFLLYFLDKKVGGFDPVHLFVPFIKITAASAIMGIFLYVPLKLLDQLVFDTTRTLSLLFLTGTASIIGLTTYLFFSWFFNIEEVVVFFNFAKKLTKVKDIVIDPSREIGGEKS